MFNLTKLLVPIDFGELSGYALDTAIDLAAKSKAKVIALHVHDYSLAGLATSGASDANARIRQEAQAALLAMVAERKERGVTVEPVLRGGIAWDEIVNTARDLDADLIVMGTHGRKGLPRAILGSVAEKVTRFASMPVLTVHAPRSGDFQHIVMATDFGPATRAAFDYAVDLACHFDAQLTLVHAYGVPLYAYAGSMYAIPDVLTPIEEAAEVSMRELLGEARKRGAKVDGHLRRGIAWEEVVTLATEQKADLIVCGTHGRRGLAYAALGSVADKIVRLAPMSVLTLRERASQPSLTAPAGASPPAARAS